MDLLPYLLPLGTSFRVEGLVIDAAAHKVIVELDAIAASCPCPSCHQLAERIHSHYWRSVVDLPWAVLLVHLHLHVRKFLGSTSCRTSPTRSSLSLRLTPSFSARRRVKSPLVASRCRRHNRPQQHVRRT